MAATQKKEVAVPNPNMNLSKEDPAPVDAPCTLTIQNKTYDMTNWANKHPGGPIIHIYHGKDATEVFKAFHGPEASRVLATFPSVPKDTLPRTKEDKKMQKDEHLFRGLNSEEILKDFDRLRLDLERDGLFASKWHWFPGKLATTCAMLPISYFLALHGYYLLSALVLGTMWQQLGWVSHELLHHQIYQDRSINTGIGWLTGCVLLGFSRIWWNDRHNAHHAATNIDGSDPDIDNLPLLAWSAEDVKRSSPAERKVIRYQQYYFWLILPLLNLIWCVNSIFFVKDVMRNSKYTWYRNRWTIEAVGIAIHYAWVLAFLTTAFSSFTGAVAFYFAAKLIAGSFLAFVVFFNHYSCPKLDFDSVAGENFVVMQLVTTRNMTPGHFTDWFWGGLNYQIEHHLFPTMPRQNLYKCSLRVRQFCAKHKLPYLCSDFLVGLGYVKTFLGDIAKIASASA